MYVCSYNKQSNYHIYSAAKANNNSQTSRCFCMFFKFSKTRVVITSNSLTADGIYHQGFQERGFIDVSLSVSCSKVVSPRNRSGQLGNAITLNLWGAKHKM